MPLEKGRQRVGSLSLEEVLHLYHCLRDVEEAEWEREDS